MTMTPAEQRAARGGKGLLGPLAREGPGSEQRKEEGRKPAGRQTASERRTSYHRLLKLALALGQLQSEEFHTHTGLFKRPRVLCVALWRFFRSSLLLISYFAMDTQRRGALAKAKPEARSGPFVGSRKRVLRESQPLGGEITTTTTTTPPTPNK